MKDHILLLTPVSYSISLIQKPLIILDTDSLLIGLTALTMDELVRDEMKSSWEQNKEKWFADETVEQSKKPGLLKREFGCSRGRFLGLSSKCYHISDGTKSKRSNKGFIYFI